MSRNYPRIFAVLFSIPLSLLLWALIAWLAFTMNAHAFDAIDLLPNTISPELVHQSHAVQHLGSDRTEYGANLVALTARWELPKGWHLELTESYNLNRDYPQTPSYGDIMGPREVFFARVGYSWRIK